MRILANKKQEDLIAKFVDSDPLGHSGEVLSTYHGIPNHYYAIACQPICQPSLIADTLIFRFKRFNLPNYNHRRDVVFVTLVFLVRRLLRSEDTEPVY